MKNSAKLSPKQQVVELLYTMDDSTSMEDIHKAISKLDTTVWKNTVPRFVFIGTGLLAFATFIYFIVSNYTLKEAITVGKLNPPEKSKITLLDYLLYTFWTIIPPSYFLWEYLKLFPYKLDSNQLADIKYTQELSSKIWAALLLAFGIILYSKYGVK